MNTKRLHRRSVRLRGFDYSQPGAYYVTICARDRICLFGHISEGRMHLNELGKVVQEEWLKTPTLRPSLQLDAFVVMPNHFHGILIFGDKREPCGAGDATPPALPVFGKVMHRSLGAIVGAFKGAVTTRARALYKNSALEVWQKNYYEHVIDDQKDLDRIREYILENPSRWESDGENPNRTRTDDFDLWIRRSRRKPALRKPAPE